MWRKVCFVPGCRNSSAKTPEKIFVTVPVAQKRREAWFAAVNRDVTEVSAISPRYCCEDHFDVSLTSKRKKKTEFVFVKNVVYVTSLNVLKRVFFNNP